MSKKKKIGILTLPLHVNYGGILQAYALMTIVKKLGHDPYFIKRERKNKIKVLIKNFIKGVVFNKEKAKINCFISKYINPSTESSSSTSKLKNIVNNYNFDMYIVGSDQVWRPKYAGDILYDFFFDFLKDTNIKKFSYAASFGTEDWEFSGKETQICKELIHKFDYISVRESSAVDLCKTKFQVDSQLVLDPTFLISKEEYISLVESYNNEKNTYKSKQNDYREIFIYILDKNENKNELIDYIEKKNKSIYAIDINKKNKVPVEEWIRSFYLSQFIITDSFHACVFSIIFNKPFLVYGNEERGLSRFTSLLKMFKLEDRLVSSQQISINDLEEKLFNKTINWEKVNIILKEKKEESLNYLVEAIN